MGVYHCDLLSVGKNKLGHTSGNLPRSHNVQGTDLTLEHRTSGF